MNCPIRVHTNRVADIKIQNGLNTTGIANKLRSPFFLVDIGCLALPLQKSFHKRKEFLPFLIEEVNRQVV